MQSVVLYPTLRKTAQRTLSLYSARMRNLRLKCLQLILDIHDKMSPHALSRIAILFAEDMQAMKRMCHDLAKQNNKGKDKKFTATLDACKCCTAGALLFLALFFNIIVLCHSMCIVSILCFDNALDGSCVTDGCSWMQSRSLIDQKIGERPSTHCSSVPLFSCESSADV